MIGAQYKEIRLANNPQLVYILNNELLPDKKWEFLKYSIEQSWPIQFLIYVAKGSISLENTFVYIMAAFSHDSLHK